MHAKYQCSIINTSEDMSKVKVFVIDGRTDGQTDRTDGRMSFNVPRFREMRGTIKVDVFVKHKCPRWQLSPKLAILVLRSGQGHKVIDLCVI